MLRTYDDVKIAWRKEGGAEGLEEWVRNHLIPCYDEECNFEGYIRRSSLQGQSNESLQ